MSKRSLHLLNPIRAAALMGLLGLFALAASSAYAGDAKDLARKNQCMSCHKEEGKLVGPAFKDVAAKYRANDDAAAKLATKVRSGGKGVWGSIPMPPNKSISDEDLETVISWILSH